MLLICQINTLRSSTIQLLTANLNSIGLSALALKFVPVSAVRSRNLISQILRDLR